jgi:topoisomerase IA-like protein
VITKEVSFIKMKSDIDFEKLYLKKSLLEDLISKGEVIKNRFTRYFDDQKVTLRNGKYGIYAEVIAKDHSKTNISLKEFGNRPLENILWEDVIKLLQEKK